MEEDRKQRSRWDATPVAGAQSLYGAATPVAGALGMWERDVWV